ncbi:MAG TPA: DNA-processing protein DprA [Nocardioides sp.]|nr:DNA-processing protein DprA [Nocardioides sp.]
MTGAVAGRASEAERLARATLSLVTEPGDPAVAAGVDREGGERFLARLRNDPALRAARGAAAARLEGADAARELERAQARRIRFVVPGDEEWPEQVEDLAHAEPLQDRGGVPVGLWVTGPLRLDELRESVAVVGCRASTMYGDQVAAELSAVVAAAGMPVVSGAAFGIDYAAHRGALSGGGRTVAVLACGVDRVYPAAHRQLVRHLGEHHAVVSESPPGAGPFRVRFLSRNRLIAALARGTVVVEAAARSGSLNTTNWAERMSRMVMGVPGPVTSEVSLGVHQLIRNGGATLVTGGPDVLELLGAPGEHLVQVPRGPAGARDHLNVRERQVLDSLPVHELATPARLARVAGLAVAEIEEALGRLEREGLVEEFVGGWRLTRRARA